MRTATTIIQMLVRGLGLIMIVLGLLFWTGNALNLIGLHMLLGMIVVLLLWALAIMAARSGVSLGLVALGIAWGLIVVSLGMTQNRLKRLCHQRFHPRWTPRKRPSITARLDQPRDFRGLRRPGSSVGRARD